MMKNELEIYGHVSTNNGIQIYIRENIWYGEKAEWCSHGLHILGDKGESFSTKVPIEQYFDYIATTIPEEYRTERIKKWLETRGV